MVGMVHHRGSVWNHFPESVHISRHAFGSFALDLFLISGSGTKPRPRRFGDALRSATSTTPRNPCDAPIETRNREPLRSAQKGTGTLTLAKSHRRPLAGVSLDSDLCGAAPAPGVRVTRRCARGHRVGGGRRRAATALVATTLNVFRVPLVSEPTVARQVGGVPLQALAAIVTVEAPPPEADTV